MLFRIFLKHCGNMSEREIIKVPIKFVVMIITFMTVAMSVIIFLVNKQFENFVKATSVTEIPTIQITSKNGPNRGMIFFSKNNYISTSAELINSNMLNCDFWEPRGGYVNPHIYSLFDLKTPYYLYKEKNNDTINAIKDSIKIQFLMKDSKLEENPKDFYKLLDSIRERIKKSW